MGGDFIYGDGIDREFARTMRIYGANPVLPVTLKFAIKHPKNDPPV